MYIFIPKIYTYINIYVYYKHKLELREGNNEHNLLNYLLFIS